MHKFKLHAQREPWWDAISFLLVDHWDPTRKAYATNVTMVTPEPMSATVIEPTFRLNMSEAQQLMDELWDCGLRPTEGTGSAGALAATQKHLDDMRQIAFGVIASAAKK